MVFWHENNEVKHHLLLSYKPKRILIERSLGSRVNNSRLTGYFDISSSCHGKIQEMHEDMALVLFTPFGPEAPLFSF